MPELNDLNEVINAILSAFRSVGAELTWSWFWYQIGLLLVAAGAARILAAIVRSRVDLTSSAMGMPGAVRRFVRALFGSLTVAFFALFVGIMRASMLLVTWPSHSYVLAVAASLATAWLVIRLMAGIVRDQLLVRIIAVVAFLIAALSILGLLEPVTAALDFVAITIGGLRLTPLLILKVAVLLSLAIWVAGLISKFIDTWLSRSGDLTPSAQVLISKLASIALIVLAVVIVLSSVGIDLSALTIFGGAIGVGLGFGLQKIVANFISGIILLVDKSVKPGDLVTIGDNFGRVSTMNVRYISVAAGDGREFLIPNEDLVTQKVVNWTYRDRNTLVEVKFGTNYDADPKVVCKLACEIAARTPRVTDVHTPVCLLTEFADYGMKYSLTFWINDPEAGMGNVRSDVMMALWDAFKREGIQVPYPVRDIRVRGALPIEAVVDASERLTHAVLLRADPGDADQALQAFSRRREARRRRHRNGACRQSRINDGPAGARLEGVAVALAQHQAQAAAVARTDRGRFRWRPANSSASTPSNPNAIVGEALRAEAIAELSGYETIRREVRYGRASRVDFLLQQASRPDCYVEVKNVHLMRRQGLAEFPDSVTDRGARHLDELGAMARAGSRAVMLFVIQIASANSLDLARDIDPAYGAAFDKARAEGVEALAYTCRVGSDGVFLAAAVPIVA